MSRLVLVLLLTVTGVVLSAPIGRAGRGAGVVVILALAAALVLAIARLARRRHPDSPLAALAPEVLVPRVRRHVARSRVRAGAAVHRRRRRARVAHAESAARAAAQDDERLTPERIASGAEALLRLVYLAWDARDRRRLATLLGPELLGPWERALDAGRGAGERHETAILGEVRIDLVGFAAGGSGAGTAVVLIEAELSVRVTDEGPARDSPDGGSPVVFGLHQYWTLSLDERPMTVLAIDERAAGDHHLREPTR